MRQLAILIYIYLVLSSYVLTGCMHDPKATDEDNTTLIIGPAPVAMVTTQLQKEPVVKTTVSLLSGQVVSGTGTGVMRSPLRFVMVQLADWNEKIIATVMTDESGHFTLKTTAGPGSYKLALRSQRFSAQLKLRIEQVPVVKNEIILEAKPKTEQ